MDVMQRSAVKLVPTCYSIYPPIIRKDLDQHEKTTQQN